MVPDWILSRRETYGDAFRAELANWLLSSQNQTETVVQQCISLLEDENLLSLPLPSGVVLPTVPGARNFRFLFRRQVASLLNWKERRAEGDAQGFTDKLNSFIRDVWWPDERAETLHGHNPDNRQVR